MTSAHVYNRVKMKIKHYKTESKIIKYIDIRRCDGILITITVKMKMLNFNTNEIG